MKTLILLVLAVIGVQAVEEKSAARSIIDIGWIAVGDQLLHRSFEQKGRVTDVRHRDDVEYRGGFFTRISAVRVTEIVSNTGSHAQIISGGLGHNRVTVRFSSALGGAYHFRFEVWGR